MYIIEITNTATGATETYEADAACIGLHLCDDPDYTSTNLGMFDGPVIHAAVAALGAKDAIKSLLESRPAVKALYMSADNKPEKGSDE